MLIEDIACPECGENATTGDHKIDCGFKSSMDVYCDLIESVRFYPDNLLSKLALVVYAEQMERQIKSKRGDVDVG